MFNTKLKAQYDIGNTDFAYDLNKAILTEATSSTYMTYLLMYCFHESEPDSRPPPVSFSPPKAPPISAPDVGMLTFTIPQSLPLGLQAMLSNKKYSYTGNLKKDQQDFLIAY